MMDLVWQALPDFLVGMRNTLLYCIAAFPLALALGLLLALMASASSVWLRGPARFFIEVVRGTPILAQIFIIYYGIGGMLNVISPALVPLVNAWTAGIASLALNYAAYEAEIYRAGILSVDKGQREAAYSLGLNNVQCFFRITLPQAIPLMIPPFVNDFIYMLKDSAVVSVIAGTDLTAVLNSFVRRHGSNPLPFYALAIVLYLALSLPASYFARLLERRLRSVFS